MDHRGTKIFLVVTKRRPPMSVPQSKSSGVGAIRGDSPIVEIIRKISQEKHSGRQAHEMATLVT
jgi:hypothetical protein